MQLPALYVHIPFCLSRCRYCAFTRGIYDSDSADRYIDALTKELFLRTRGRWETYSTLFIGGGTPSSLSYKQLHNLLIKIMLHTFSSEATIELNPDSADDEKIRLCKNIGINRVSFGVQTFSPEGLALLGRRHDAETACSRIAQAVEKGFASVSLDLISAWPGQTLASFAKDLETAVSLGVDHISCYNLIVEEETPLGKEIASGKIRELDDAEARGFWDMAEDILGQNGFRHYEVSNFAKPGKECLHNLNGWTGGEYLGVGLAAHSHLAGRRFANTEHMDRYLEEMANGRFAEEFSEQLEPERKAKETAVMWLRLADGIDTGAFRKRTGFDLRALYADILPDLLGEEVVEFVRHKDGGVYFRLSSVAYPLADMVLERLV